ncbi:hypothetical protein [Streptomyces sp. NPDC051219]|uniref:hypothetical protein n=1 Tax=Streptomyces sp. NPDC051219 TaxID=3155283 RepID=UPI00342BCEAC
MGARTGAPNAVQVADRFHLWQNVGTAVEASIRLHSKCRQMAVTSPDGPTNDDDSVGATTAMSPIETGIRERHATVHALLAQGHGTREIARELQPRSFMSHRQFADGLLVRSFRGWGRLRGPALASGGRTVKRSQCRRPVCTWACTRQTCPVRVRFAPAARSGPGCRRDGGTAGRRGGGKM